MTTIKTPDLRSYDETLTLPIEIRLAPGPIPSVTAIYDGQPDVEYDGLADLCVAHQLDPEVLDNQQAQTLA